MGPKGWTKLGRFLRWCGGATRNQTARASIKFVSSEDWPPSFLHCSARRLSRSHASKITACLNSHAACSAVGTLSGGSRSTKSARYESAGIHSLRPGFLHPPWSPWTRKSRGLGEQKSRYGGAPPLAATAAIHCSIQASPKLGSNVSRTFNSITSRHDNNASFRSVLEQSGICCGTGRP